MPLETDKNGGFKFELAAELRSGLYPGLFSSAIPLWETGQNVQFTDVGIEKLKGNYELIDTGNSEPIRGMVQLTESGTTALVYAGDLTSLYRVDIVGTSFTDVSGETYSLNEDSGSSVWDTGSSTWDGDTSLWDAGVSQADHWSMVNYGTFVLATSGADTPQIYKGSGKFVNMVKGITGITIVSGGTGYSVGDVLTFTGGDGTGATATVISESSGVITAIGMTTGGVNYTTAPTGHTGASTDATFTHTIGNMDVTTVEIFVNRGPHVLGFNTSTSPKEFIWCAADDPDDWVTSTTNLAGNLQIRELKSAIVAAVPLGNRIAVYGTDQMFLVTYLANDFVFGYQPALNGIGSVSKHAVIPVGRHNYGLSEQGFFVTDGIDFDYIDEPAIHSFYRRNVNLGQIAKTNGWHDEENNQVRWYFPTLPSAEITTGVTYNYRDKTWGIVTGDRTAGDERRVISNPISGTETGQLLIEGGTNNDDGAAMTAYARSKPFSLGSADMVKELDSIRIGFVGAGLQYRIGWAETEDGSITWGSYTDMGTGWDVHNLRTAGRWLFFELYSATLNANWEVMGAEFIGRTEGTR